MAVVFKDANVEKNADGLVMRYHKAQGAVQKAGEYCEVSGDRHITEVIVSLPGLPTLASTNKMILNPTTTIPNGAFVEMVRVVVLKETAGANANFNLGLVDQDCTTEVDFDGLLAAADIFNGGTDLGQITDYVLGTTEVGALVGSKVTNSGYLVGWVDTADFTAGVLKIQIFWSVPLAADL